MSVIAAAVITVTSACTTVVFPGVPRSTDGNVGDVEGGAFAQLPDGAPDPYLNGDAFSASAPDVVLVEPAEPDAAAIPAHADAASDASVCSVADWRFASAPCAECAGASCCGQLEACSVSDGAPSACKELLACIQACATADAGAPAGDSGGSSDCTNSCLNSFGPAATQQLGAVFQCLNASGCGSGCVPIP